MKRTVSILLASALLLSLASCGPKGESSDPQGSQSSSQSQAEAVFTTLKEPTYPEFPQFPQQPEDGPDADWDSYYNAYDEYYSAVMELRSGGIPEGTRFALSDFAAKSTPLALAGQEGKNAAYSPASLWAALAMLVPCAQGDSQAQLLSALLCLAYMRKKLSFLRIRKTDMQLEPMLMRLTTSYAAVAALQQSSLYLGKLMIQSAVNGISTDAISAFTATTRVENFTQAFGISACEAIAIFVAQNQGAKQYRRANRGFLQGFAITTAIGLGFSLLLGFFAQPMVSLFLGDDLQSIPLGVSYLQLMAWFYFLSFIGHSYVGHYRGIGRMNITFFGTTLQIVVRVIGTYLLVGAMGLDAVALSTGLGWVVIVLFHSTVYLLERRGIGYHLSSEDGPPPKQA